jgi:hypothetical protein
VAINIVFYFLVIQDYLKVMEGMMDSYTFNTIFFDTRQNYNPFERGFDFAVGFN